MVRGDLMRSRRQWLAAGGVGAVGAAMGIRAAGNAGLIPPDCGGLYGAGHTLTYAAHRLLFGNALAREFPKSNISQVPVINGEPLKGSEPYKKLQSGGFSEWRLSIDGLVDKPATLSLAALRSMPARSQVTQLICEEGWSYIAEWTGTPLVEVLRLAGVKPNARYIFHRSMDGWTDALDIVEARHPQTLLTYAMNGADLPSGHGAPLRLRLPRQLGYKSMKYLTHLTAVEELKDLKTGGYSWYAGI